MSEECTNTNPMISAEMVKKITHLAKLELKETEIAHHCAQLDSILHFVAQLEQVNTDDIEPMYSAHALKQRLREDKVIEVDEWETFQHNAPRIEGSRFYAVPKAVSSKGDKT